LLNSPTIIIEHATLRFRQQFIFENLHCEIAAGCFTCLLGPSGVGKSTLLKMIAHIIDSHDATVSAAISTKPKLDLAHNIAYMAQTDLLLPWLTVLNNALLFDRLNKSVSKEKKAAAQKLLANVGLADHINAYPEQLSGGMRQRVALVRTLLQDKPIILMDEPFSALDAITRLKLQDLAAELLIGKTVLLVTHDPLEALRLGHKIFVMSGSPATLGEAIIPEGTIPRETTNADVLQLQGRLLTQLEQAQAAA
jgi:putative hydroxymethylpyrimidine transport system ATP-binding protein